MQRFIDLIDEKIATLTDAQGMLRNAGLHNACQTVDAQLHILSVLKADVMVADAATV